MPNSIQQQTLMSRQDVLEIIKRLRQGESVPTHLLDFRGVSLLGEDLSGLNLSGADFSEADLSGAYRLRRFIVDQNYLYEFKNINTYSRITYWIWLVSSDCGRSLLRWFLCIAALSMLFTWLYTFIGIDYGENPNWIAPLYYSMVTLSTLGYGDIVPITSLARVVALVEVMVGYVMLGGVLSIFANKMVRRGE